MITLSQLTNPVRLTWRLEAIVDTALCVGAGGSTGSINDKPIVRNAQGQLIIPGSQIKGRLRHECEKLARGLGWWIPDAPLADALYLDDKPEGEANPVPAAFREPYRVANYPGYHCWISQLFGDPMLPSRLIVDDLVCPYRREELPEVIRPGVSINRSRQTAEDQKLFYLETSPMGAGLPFAGEIHFLQQCPSHAEPLLITAISHLKALGGGKSGGLGWLHWRHLPAVPIADATSDQPSDQTNWSALLLPTSIPSPPSPSP